ncbi:MAG: rRNA methyltransferase, partial [Actinomycetia bacterium]|nr:rRNA methyltransferase [Actinomycetes bacterium]
RVALVLGTEGDGLTTAALDACDRSVRIPMHNGVDSLNVAAAAAIVCWALRSG